MYATPANLLERYEADLVAQRAAPEGLRVTGDMLKDAIYDDDLGEYQPDQVAAIERAISRMESVLNDATEFVNSYLSDRYSLPLNPLPQMVVRLTCSVARFYLWGDEAIKDSVAERDYLAAMKTLQSIRSNDVTLGSAVKPQPTSDAGAGAGEVSGPERIFSRETMRGL